MADDEQAADAEIAKLLAQSNNLLQSDGMTMNDDNIELTAEDMEDPELLAQLAEFGDIDDGDDDGMDDDDDGNGDDGDGMFEEMKSTTLRLLQQVSFQMI